MDNTLNNNYILNVPQLTSAPQDSGTGNKDYENPASKVPAATKRGSDVHKKDANSSMPSTKADQIVRLIRDGSTHYVIRCYGIGESDYNAETIPHKLSHHTEDYDGL